MSQVRNLLIAVTAFRCKLLSIERFRQVARVLLVEPQAEIDELLESWVGTQTLNDVIAQVDSKVAESDGQLRAALQELVAHDDDVSPDCKAVVHEVLGEYLQTEPPPAGASSASAVSGAVAPSAESVPLNLDVTYLTSEPQADFDHTAQYGKDPDRGESDETIQRQREVRPQGTRTRYLLTRVEGAGGLGQVWLARDPLLKREVALKENIPGKGSPEGTKRLVREAQITGLLEHPNIIPVYELGHRPEDGEPFYTMRFVKDETLARYIKRFHQDRLESGINWMALRQLLDCFVGVCNALAYAHDHGVMHRDLKPSNVMMGEFGEVIVLDWGLATFLGEHADDVALANVESADPEQQMMTRDGQIIGTPAYMAPEQALGERSRMGIATDIYGLGGILFAILAGVAPNSRRKDGSTHRGTNAMLMSIGSGEIPEPRDLEGWVPRPLNAICRKALALKPENRYLTATALADDVRRWMADEPVSCFSEPFSVKALRWLRRHRTWAQAISTSLILIAIVSTVAGIWIESARRDEATARAGANLAYVAEREAREAAEAARSEALQHFQQARDAVDKSLTGFSSVLEYFPAAGPVREQLLQEAASDYERFAAEKSDVPEIRAEAGIAWYRLGDVRMTLKQSDEAAAAYARAIETFEALTKQVPDEPEYVIQQAISCGRLSALNETRRESDAATRLFNRAETLLLPLVTSDSPQAQARDALATLLLNRARVAARLRDEDQARNLLTRARSQLDALVAEKDLDEYRFRLAAADDIAGTIELQFGDAEAAVTALKQARLEYSDLTLRHRDNPRYFEGLAGSKVALANALGELGQSNEALEQNQSALEDFELLSDARPGIPDYQRNAAVTQINIAQILLQQGAGFDARPYGMEALERLTALLTRFPDADTYLNAHATCSSTLGMILRDLNEDDSAIQLFENSIALFDRLAGEVPDMPEYQRRLGISLTSLGRTLHKTGRHSEAAEAFNKSLLVLDQLLTRDNTDDDARNALAWSSFHYGMLLHEIGEPDPETKQFARAFAEWSRLVKDSVSPERLHDLAFLLVHCPVTAFQDAAGAFERCTQATDAAPRNSRYWNLRALAALRNNDLPECVRCVTVAKSFRQRENAADEFVLALAEAQRGNREDARQHLTQGIAVMDAQQPGNLELLRLRHEGESLLETPASN
ncbi:protein kinase [bacterium]|nr:protein kinase [bacterium]